MAESTQPAHSKIGASSYYRWSKTHGGCPGSVALSEGIESPSSPYAQEGTLAHEIAAEVLEHHFFSMGERYTIPHGTEPEMMDAIRVYTDFIKQEANRARASISEGHVLIEHKFDLSSVHEGLFGTADGVIYHPEEKKLMVADYKHGAGIAVEVEDNLQLQYYGLGALLSTNFPCETVEIVVVQPRCEHPDGKIRRWAFKSIDLLDFAADLAYDAHYTENPDAELNPGKHCRFCPAAAAKCTAIKEKAQSLAKVQFKTELSYDPDKLSDALKVLPALEAWAKQVREFAYGEAMHGRAPEGWKLVPKRGTRQWTAAEEIVVEYMTTAAKKDESDCYEWKIKSPAKMEKMLSKQLGKDLRKMMQTVSSGYNLVAASDPRPAVKLDPQSDFNKIEG